MKKKKLHQRFVVTFMIACLALLLPGTTLHAQSNPLCITAKEANVTVNFNLRAGMPDVQYSTDNCTTWTTSDSSSSARQISVPLTNVGDKVYFKSENASTAYGASTEASSSRFTFTGDVEASGNIMSLYNYGSSLPSFAFSYLFSKCTKLSTAPELPATTLNSYCYNNMFSGCTALQTAPELPAISVPARGYLGMFDGCSSLITAPDLPATTIAFQCYKQMFRKCAALTTAPDTLPATTLSGECYMNMFSECTSLVTAPTLPAKILGDKCYNSMFYKCSSLNNVPELPATNLAKNCYQSMFQGCTGITFPPELPATTLTNSCYSLMFADCSSLKYAPELPAKTLDSACYYKMFYNSRVRSIPALPAETLTTKCYQSMFEKCAYLCLSTTKTTGQAWSIKSIDTTINNNALLNMFNSLSSNSDFKGTPAIGTTYYIVSGVSRSTKAEGDWNNENIWTKTTNGIPNGADTLIIKHTTTIPAGVYAYCYSITFSYTDTSTGKLIIEPGATLHATTITNSDASKLILQADENNSVATVRFTDTNFQPKATVEMYFKGTTINNGDGTFNPDWQYRGFIGNPDATQADFGTGQSDFANIVIYKWNEQSTTNDCWEAFYGGSLGYNYASGESFNGETWNGFSMANYANAGTKKTYTTILVPTSQGHTYNLTRTEARSGLASGDEVKNKGVNLITNSYSAPIDISSSSITWPSNMEQTVYIFKTDAHSETTTASQFVTYPSVSGSTLANPPYIPAGQSFLVWVQSGSTADFTIPAAALSTTTSPAMYAPRKEARFGVLKIEAESENGFDDLYLLTNDDCSAEFDNGYDGSKMFSSKAHQIYAQNEYGTTAVNADRTLLGQYVGFRPLNGSNESVTFTITTRDLDDYEELYLYDYETGTFTDLMDGEATYTFNAPSTENAKRFQIVGKATDGTSFNPTEAQRIDIAGGEVWLTNFDRSDAQVIMTDAAGRTIWSVNAKEGTHFTLPEVAAGVYFISCGKTTTKYIPRSR